MLEYGLSWKVNQWKLQVSVTDGGGILLWRKGFQFSRNVNGLSGILGSTENFFDLRVFH
jgi:hypothetical protein